MLQGRDGHFCEGESRLADRKHGHPSNLARGASAIPWFIALSAKADRTAPGRAWGLEAGVRAIQARRPWSDAVRGLGRRNQGCARNGAGKRDGATQTGPHTRRKLAEIASAVSAKDRDRRSTSETGNTGR